MSSSLPILTNYRNEGSFPSGKEMAVVGDAVEIPEEIYQRIVQQVRGIEAAIAPENDSANTEGAGILLSEPTAPLAPETLQDTGLSLDQLADLTVKLMYLNGAMRGYEVARQLRFPYPPTDQILQSLEKQRFVERDEDSEGEGRKNCRFHLTEAGREQARMAFTSCRYVGPAPVSLEQYTYQCRQQSLRKLSLKAQQFRDAFQELVLDQAMIMRLGPAVCSGQSLILHGPSGNGKTTLAHALGKLISQFGGVIYVPYAISIDQQIVAVFDPTVHHAVDDSRNFDLLDDLSSSQQVDARWRRIRRPFVSAGADFELEMLDLKHHAASGFYTAPLHLKANGGLLLIDDFGRQSIPTQLLLNRWVQPLESHLDTLPLITGRKMTIPVEQLILFATNLPLEECMDAPFLRRIRHKILLPFPTPEQFKQMFQQQCEQRDIKYDDWILTRLLNAHYNPQSPPKFSDARDLLDVIEAFCRFRGERPHLSEKNVFDAYQEFQSGQTSSS